MFFHTEGGVFERFVTEARENLLIEIWGNPETRWPIIERSDLARVYCELLVRADLMGHFNAVSEEVDRVGDIARKFAKAYGNTHDTKVLNVDDLIYEHGSWAKGRRSKTTILLMRLRSSRYRRCTIQMRSHIINHMFIKYFS